MWVTALFAATALAYAAAAGLYLTSLIKGNNRATRFARWTLLGAIALQVAFVSMDVSLGSPMGRMHQTLTGLSVGIALAFLLAQLRRENISVLGAFLVPVALFFFLGSGIGRSVEHASNESLLVPIHIVVNVLGLVAFALAFGASLAYVLQERMLRRKNLGGLFERLPALDVLDRFGLRAVLVGFPLLTLGILSGAFWAFRLEQAMLGFTASHAFAFIAWTLFAGVLGLRMAAGWRGRRAAYGTIVGFLCTSVVLVGYMLRTGLSS